jgi:hypothetical protein
MRATVIVPKCHAAVDACQRRGGFFFSNRKVGQTPKKRNDFNGSRGIGWTG